MTNFITSELDAFSAMLSKALLMSMKVGKEKPGLQTGFELSPVHISVLEDEARQKLIPVGRCRDTKPTARTESHRPGIRGTRPDPDRQQNAVELEHVDAYPAELRCWRLRPRIGTQSKVIEAIL